MKTIKVYLVTSILLLSFKSLKAQSIDPTSLPKYVVIGAENTKIFGGIGIHINKKKSDSKNAFYYLEYYLHKEEKVRTISDLLNAMDKIGFEYINAFESSGKSLGLSDNHSNAGVYGGGEKKRFNVVFKKYSQY